MPRRSVPKAHEHFHKDGSLWARGELTRGVMTGYWEWFRKDGSLMRSGWFDRGAQVGEWRTYDRRGRLVKATQMKPKHHQAAGRKSAAARVNDS